MKKKYFFLLLLVMGWLGSTAKAEDYLMPQYGHETKVVSKDAPLTFYDFKGADTHFNNPLSQRSSSNPLRKAIPSKSPLRN